MKKVEIVLLLLVLTLGFVLRLYKINRPIADWHSWRQADTAAVSRNFIKDGFNPFVPKYDDMSNQANAMDNPNRYRFVEFPIYNSIITAVWLVTGVNETYARLVTVVISLGSIALLYFLVKKFSSWQTAILASFFFATIPYNVFYSSTILPAPLMVFALLALYLSFIKFLGNDKNMLWLIASIFFANIAILTWPIALIFMLPPIYLSQQKYGLSFIKNIRLCIIAAVSLIPFIAWRIWMNKFPEGIPSILFILNDNGIRFKGAFFRWLISERIGKIILSATGFPIFILGMLAKPVEREKLFYISILISTLLYFSIFASGNIRHDYYQTPFMIIASIFLAKGTVFLFQAPSFLNKWLAPITGLFLIVLMYAFTYYEVRGFYWVNHPEIVEAGKAVDKLLPKDATVIAPYGGDTAFLYQTNRHGYPVVDRPLIKFIESGTKYLVSVDPNDAGIKKLVRDCNVVSRSSLYVIVEMSQQCI